MHLKYLHNFEFNDIIPIIENLKHIFNIKNLLHPYNILSLHRTSSLFANCSLSSILTILVHLLFYPLGVFAVLPLPIPLAVTARSAAPSSASLAATAAAQTAAATDAPAAAEEYSVVHLETDPECAHAEDINIDIAEAYVVE